MQSTIGLVVYIGFFFALMYFLLIRPQKKRQKQMNDLRDNLQLGDTVVTIGGIVGKIMSVKGDDIVLDIDGKSKVTFKKWAISSVENKDEKSDDQVDPAEVK